MKVWNEPKIFRLGFEYTREEDGVDVVTEGEVREITPIEQWVDEGGINAVSEVVEEAIEEAKAATFCVVPES